MRLSLVGHFLLKVIAWFIVLLFIWYQLGSLVTIPVCLPEVWLWPALAGCHAVRFKRST
ncbi:hypothetical protein [Candidatus Nitrotoga sp. HW29]|uniref:hypothetical protein n=1 Tax=Candidatus Nitrotoga sp. HW29 TaxID=2886963 RepID=UPI001EF370EB|nr:hypothetical protein [Candidatus Nitrotoga sp. HW29]